MACFPISEIRCGSSLCSYFVIKSTKSAVKSNRPWNTLDISTLEVSRVLFSNQLAPSIEEDQNHSSYLNQIQ